MRVTLWRRAPREVYRVYGEDEYFAETGAGSVDEDTGSAEEGSVAHGHPSIRPPFEAPSPVFTPGRVLALALLTASALGALALVVLNGAPPHSPHPRPGLGRVPRAIAGDRPPAPTGRVSAIELAERPPAHRSSAARDRARDQADPPPASTLISRRPASATPTSVVYPTPPSRAWVVPADGYRQDAGEGPGVQPLPAPAALSWSQPVARSVLDEFGFER
jgi:hypothetical protein